MWNIGTLYFEQDIYNTALACLLLAKDIFKEAQSPRRDGIQQWINDLQEEVGEDQFTALLSQVEPQARQIVEQALREGLSHDE